MVKETKIRVPRPPITKSGRPRIPPGKKARPDDVRTERLVLRVHPNLMEILTGRARERGITRSAYVEQLLVGWARLDPRNPKLDLIGKLVAGAQDPNEVRIRSPFNFAERWSKFAAAHTLLLGAPPPNDWVESPDMPLPEPDPRAGRHPYSDDDPPNPPFKRR